MFLSREDEELLAGEEGRPDNNGVIRGSTEVVTKEEERLFINETSNETYLSQIRTIVYI